MFTSLFGAASAGLALHQKVVLQAPALRNTFGVRTAGDAPITAAYGRSTPVIHLEVVDICPGADIGSAPAFASKR